jgi:hypothetical protein
MRWIELSDRERLYRYASEHPGCFPWPSSESETYFSTCRDAPGGGDGLPDIMTYDPGYYEDFCALFDLFAGDNRLARDPLLRAIVATAAMKGAPPTDEVRKGLAALRTDLDGAGEESSRSEEAVSTYVYEF